MHDIQKAWIENIIGDQPVMKDRKRGEMALCAIVLVPLIVFVIIILLTK